MAAFVLGGFGEGGYVGVALEEFADAAAEDAGTVSVDDADAGEAGQEGAVEIFFEIFGGFVDGAADEVDFHAHVVGVGAGNGDLYTLLLAGGGEGIGPFCGLGAAGAKDLGDVVALDAHFDGAESDFKEILFDFALDGGYLVHRLEADLIAGGNVADDMRLGVGVALIGSAAMRDDGLVEAFLKLAAQADHAALRFFRELLLGGAVFNGAHVFAHLELEILEQGGQLGFKLAGAGAQLGVAFAGEAGTLLIEGVLLLAGGFAIGFELGELVVEAIEEAGDIHLLGAEALPGGGNDAGVEAEALGGLDAGGGAGTPRRSW